MYIYRPVHHIRGILPELADEISPGEDLSGIGGKQEEDVIFLARKRNRSPVNRHILALEVYRDAFQPDDRRLAAAGRRALQHCLDPGNHLIDGKRLADVVISAGREARQKIVLGTSCSKEYDGDIALVYLPQGVRELESGHSRKHNVKKDKIRRNPFADLSKGFLCGFTLHSLITGSREIE